MSWEGPPAHRPWWRSSAVAVAVVLVIVGALAVWTSGSDGEPQLTVTSTDDLDQRAVAPATDPRPERIAAVEMATDTAGSGPLVAEAPDVTIVAADFGSRLQLVDVASGDVRALNVFAEGTRSRPMAVQVLGAGLVLDTAGDVIRIADDDPDPAVVASGHSSIPTYDSTSVWVFNGVESSMTGVASRVDFDGTVHDRLSLPALARPLAGTGDSLIVATPTAVSRIFDDAGQHEEIARGHGLVSDGARLARLDCAANLSCGIVIGTFDNPNQVRVPLEPDELPSDMFGVPEGRFSPDGRWLALSVRQAQRGQMTDRPLVMIIDVTLGAVAQRVPGSPLTQPGTPIAWSPDSRWLAVSTGTDLLLWDAERNTVTELDIRLRPTYALAMR